MLVDGCSTPGSASPSLLDSPTLARVERARLRQEGGTPQLRHTCCQGLLNGNGARELTTIKRGLLWQQRDRLFSRWKERYFILTKDYLHCFKRSSGGADKISEMGQFIFKVKLVDVESVEWLNRKSYSAVALDVAREGRVLLRATDGLEDWFELLEECMLASKERRRALRFSHESSWQKDETHNNNSVNSSLEEWLLARHKIAGLTQQGCDSVPDLQASEGGRPESRVPQDSKGFFDGDDHQEPWLRRRPPRHEQRLSLLTDIDLNGCDLQLDTPPPSAQSTYRGRPQSYRLNSDIFFMTPGSRMGSVRDQSDRIRYNGSTASPSISSSRSVLTPVGSFRGSSQFNPQKHLPINRLIIPDKQPEQILRYRDRSHSDVHCKSERRNWQKPQDLARRLNYMVHATQV